MLLAKMKVLDSGYLNMLEPRLTSVYHRVNRTADKKETSDQMEKFNKVSKISFLYDIISCVINMFFMKELFTIC